jgi:hypothetical protein
VEAASAPVTEQGQAASAPVRPLDLDRVEAASARVTEQGQAASAPVTAMEMTARDLRTAPASARVTEQEQAASAPVAARPRNNNNQVQITLRRRELYQALRARLHEAPFWCAECVNRRP